MQTRFNSFSLNQNSFYSETINDLVQLIAKTINYKWEVDK